jgi:hypothetical protein
VGLVAALLVAAVAPIAVITILAVFEDKALVSRPRLNQSANYAEVLVRQQLAIIGLRYDLVEQLHHRIEHNESRAIFGENRGHPDCIVHGQSDESAKKHVVLN